MADETYVSGPHDLPSGIHVDLKPVQIVTERHRKPIKRAMAGLSQQAQMDMRTLANIRAARKRIDDFQKANPGAEVPVEMEIPAELADFSPNLSPDDVDAMGATNEWLAVALLQSWSQADPVSWDGVVDLPTPDYDALLRLVAPAFTLLFPDFTPDQANPDSPTSPSAASEAPSEGSPASASQISPTTGAPTASSSLVSA